MGATNLPPPLPPPSQGVAFIPRDAYPHAVETEVSAEPVPFRQSRPVRRLSPRETTC